MFFATEPKIEWDEYGEVIEPDDFKDAALLASRQARRNLMEDADGDAAMENQEEEEADTRPTKTVTSEVTVLVRLALSLSLSWMSCWIGS